MTRSAFEEIEANLAAINARIADACGRAGRIPQEVTVVAACKKQSVEKVQAYVDLCRGQKLRCILAYNFVQEFKEIIPLIKGEYEVHLIGALQRNKARDAAAFFDVIETVHSEALAAEINKEAEKLSKVQPVFVQVNISEDAAKSGFAVASAREFILGKLPEFGALKLEGLMTITRLYAEAADTRADFASMRELRDDLRLRKPDLGSLPLSMGMSDDFEYAVEEGASYVRLGTVLFGARNAG